MTPALFLWTNDPALILPLAAANAFFCQGLFSWMPAWLPELFPTHLRATAPMVIYYAALPFVRLENGGLAPGEAVECPHSSAVIRRADAMSRNEANAGAVPVARIDGPDLGDLDHAMILKTFGDVPDDFDYGGR
jgi:hypothetical protein